MTLIVFLVVMASVFAETKFIVTSSLDEKKMPTDNLTEIPFDNSHEYLMFLYNDDNSAFGVEKVYLELSIYNDEASDYKYETLYTIDTKTDWGYCYKGIKFNVPMKIRVRAFTDNGELATKYISVVK